MQNISGHWQPTLLAALGIWVSACGDSPSTTATDSGATTVTTLTATDPSTGAATVPTTSGVSATGTVTDSAGSESNSATMATTDPTSATGTTAVGTGSTGEPGSTTAVASTTSASSTGNADSTTGPPPVCEPGDMMGGGMVDKSFIWVPSSDSSDVAKINTQTLQELARYRVGAGGDSPSRTAVSADGRMVVVNSRETGHSVMIAANVEDCVDKNGNGMIDTSQNKDDLRPWLEDECLRWNIQWPYAGSFQDGPRGVTWTPGTWSYDECKYINPKVWIGYQAAGGEGHFARVDGETGTVEETLVAPAWNGQGYAPYGAALDPQFRPWFGGLRGEFLRVDTDQNPITLSRFTPPGNTQSYGFTVDPDGHPWFAGCYGSVSTYDPVAMTYTEILGQQACFRGIAADENYVWAAANGPCGLLQIDRKTNTMVKFHVTNPCSTAIGVSIDAEKFVWLIDQEGWGWKIDPMNVDAMQMIPIAGSHYVYSDMTGGQLQSILPQ
jgi:hypothetical protein